MNQNVYDLLIKNNYKVYIATRFYDYSQKIQAEELEKTILKALTDVTNIGEFNPVPFVPFRNINEDELVSDDKALCIFQKDVEGLSSVIICLVGIYNVIYKDDGIAFEIGYLYTRSISVFLLNIVFI